MDNTVGSLTQQQKSIIVGSILGDGYLRIVPGRTNALLEINHSNKQKEYVDWKYQNLKDLAKSPPQRYKGNGKRVAYRFNTRQNPMLTQLYEKYYRRGKKSIPKMKLDPLILAVWFMDDGSKSYRTYYLNTQQFDYDSQLELIYALRKSFGIESALNRDKKYYRIRIKQNSADRFKRLVRKHIIPSMEYKIE